MARLNLDDITIAHYQIIGGKFSREYIPFYRNLASAYSDTKEGLGAVIRGELSKINEAIPLLVRVTGRTTRTVTKKELERLNKLIISIQKTQKEITGMAKSSAVLRKEVEQAGEGLGISLSNLDFSKTSYKQVKDLAVKGGAEIGGVTRALGFGGPRATVTLGVLAQMLGPVLGPLGGPLLGGYEALRGLVYTPKLLGGIIKGGVKGIAPLGRGIAHPLSSIGAIGGALNRAVNPWAGQGRAAPSMGTVAGETSMLGGMTSMPSSIPFRGLSRSMKMEASEPIYYFFNRRAYKAKWTRDLLKNVKKISRGGLLGGGEGGFTKGVLTGSVLGSLLLKGVKSITVLGGVSILAYSTTDLIKRVWDAIKKAREEGKSPTAAAMKEIIPQPGESWLTRAKKGFQSFAPLGFLAGFIRTPGGLIARTLGGLGGGFGAGAIGAGGGLATPYIDKAARWLGLPTDQDIAKWLTEAFEAVKNFRLKPPYLPVSVRGPKKPGPTPSEWGGVIRKMVEGQSLPPDTPYYTNAVGIVLGESVIKVKDELRSIGEKVDEGLKAFNEVYNKIYGISEGGGGQNITNETPRTADLEDSLLKFMDTRGLDTVFFEW